MEEFLRSYIQKSCVTDVRTQASTATVISKSRSTMRRVESRGGAKERDSLLFDKLISHVMYTFVTFELRALDVALVQSYP